VPESSTVWANWAGNQRCAPVAVEHPAGEDDLVRIVKQAAAEGRTVKVVGAGHSFTDIACTDGVLVHLDRYRRVLSADPATGQVTVQAGIPISALNLDLARRGLAMPNLGDIAYQSIAGAIATATHGTGVKLGGIATQVMAMELITGDGSVVRCSADEEPEVFHAARVGLGALGLVSTVTLQAVPAFDLHVREGAERVDALLENIDAEVDGNDHFEFFYVPHTGWALTKRNNRTDRPRAPRPRAKAWVDDVLFQNVVFGALCRVGRMRPSLIPRLSRMVPSAVSPSEYVDESWRVYASPRYVHFVEMEYSIPRAACVAALTEVRRFIDGSGLNISFPIEVRFTAGDDIPLSTAYGEPRCYIAVHVYRGMEYTQYFRAVEAIMDGHGGRPHWGKMHYQSAATLRDRYPEWDRFQAVRARLDPDGRFRNRYLDRVLG
jgi:L-gulono-1,4-lactone dehydrogenase